MDATWVALIVIAAVVVIALAAWAVMRSRKRAALKDRFGPEYDRTVESSDRRRDAERQLAERAKRRDELDIRDLSPAARTRYLEEWHDVQARFVDDPTMATNEADSLIARVMRDRGYPVDDFDTRADMVSTDAPESVRHYRDAHDVWKRHQEGDATTEELRNAMVHYRAVFDELVGAGRDGDGRTSVAGEARASSFERDRDASFERDRERETY
jgi:hypothetical protein